MLYFDLDLRKFVLGPNTTQLLGSIDQKRSPNAEIPVQFLRGITPQELASGASGVFEVKESGKYDANSVFRAGSWTKEGTGVNTIYYFVLDAMTPEGDRILGVDEPIEVTSTFATDLLNATAHGLSDGNKGQFSTTDTLPAPLQPNTDYFVRDATANTFKVSLTSGGTAINLADDGIGTHEFRRTDNDASSVTLMAAMQFVESGRTTESQDLVFIYRNDIVREGDTSPVPDPEDIILNVRAGVEDIPNGAEGGSVIFDTAFAPGLTYVIPSPGVSKPTAGGDQIFATIVEDSITETGFDYELSNATPNGNHKLHYMAVAI